MTFRLLSVAEAELKEAVDWYNDQAPRLGDAFLVEAQRVFRPIERHPSAWQHITSTTRRCRMARFPYGVIYAEAGPEILILAIAHLHRAPTYWRDRLGPKTPHED